jgi:hypothetical protein
MSVTVKLKHSSVQDKAPTAGDLTDGELALNVNANSPAAYIKDSAGNIVKLAGAGAVGADDKWTRIGTELAPTNAGDDVFTSGSMKVGGTTGSPNISLKADGSAEFDGKVTTASTEDTDPGETVVTKDYLEGAGSGGTGTLGYWTRTGTELSPVNAGDDVFTSGDVKVGGTTAAPLAKIDGSTGAATAADVTVTNVKSAMALATDSTGKIIPATAKFTWDANDDIYVRVPVADRDISVQARMRRCLVTDAGVVTYLDADDSTKLAGDWIRLCETTELGTAYTGTHGTEVQNTLLRALAPAWAAGTFTKGALVTNGGSVWECVAATTTATPGAGTAAATLDGTAGQVMVEIPTFSVYHRGDVVGKHCRHQWAVSLGAAQGGGYVTHPAFVKPDGSIRKAIYIGAYQGTGTNGNGSASGVNNTTNMTRAACRTACAGRGTGWHQLGYAEYNALQLLLLTEYQDLNSQKVLGNGAMAGATYVVNTGLSNGRGNRSENVHTPAGANTNYVSYRGVENIYGRAWQWTDGINVNERAAYVCTDPSKWADDTATDYDAVGVVPAGSGSYIRDVFSAGTYLLPRSVDGGSGTTYTGDALWTSSGWRVARVGGLADYGAPVGALCVALYDVSSYRGTALGGRLAYAQ